MLLPAQYPPVDRKRGSNEVDVCSKGVKPSDAVKCAACVLACTNNGGDPVSCGLACVAAGYCP